MSKNSVASIKNEKHYVVLHSWAADYEGGRTLIGVFHTPEDAQTAFDKKLVEEKKFAEEHGFVVFSSEASTGCFDAGVEGEYVCNHTLLEIIEG